MKLRLLAAGSFWVFVLPRALPLFLTSYCRTIVHRLLASICAFLLAFSASVATGYADGGATPLSTLGVGARAKGMGGAFVAVPDAATSFSWNPAGSAMAQETTVFAERTALLPETPLNAVSYTARIGRFGVLTAALRSVSSTGIPKTDDTGKVIGTFDYAEHVPSLGWAHQFGPKIAVGTQIKWLAQNLADASGRGLGLDLGVQVVLVSDPAASDRNPMPTGLYLGAAVHNVFSTPVTWSTGEADQPDRHLKIGLAYPFGMSNWSGIVTGDWSNLDGSAVGVELSPERAMWVARGGLRQRQGDLSFTLGLGLKLESLSLDYAFATENGQGDGVPALLGNTHHISISVRL